jgi:mannose-6-phosphate isomerase
MKLERRSLEKPWGSRRIPAVFGESGDHPIGEFWYVGPENMALLCKYIFTSERLSIQVHPNDEQARARGLASGKSECWYIVEAEAGATIGLGLKRDVSTDELRSAALDGSIVELVNWRAVRAGDFYYVPPGTVHAIGAGISLVEIQQNADVTYRLYDYGRPRELHLDDGLAVAHAGPYDSAHMQHVMPSDDRALLDGAHFSVFHCVGTGAEIGAARDGWRWVLPLDGRAFAGADVGDPGDCLLVPPGETLVADAGRLLIGAAA